MLINKSIISDDFEVLKAGDFAGTAKGRLEQLNLKSMPVVDTASGKLIGRFTQSRLEKNEGDEVLGEMELSEPVKVYYGQHLFEAARLMVQYELPALPVVDKEGLFLGVINKQAVLSALTKMLNLTEFGSMITIELAHNDFSISEVVQIIEVEDAKILGLAVEPPDKENQSFQVSIKLNLQDTSRIVAALRRYGYTVIAGIEAEVLDEDIENRAGELIRYMDM